jgi:hypothetical protein
MEAEGKTKKPYSSPTVKKLKTEQAKKIVAATIAATKKPPIP